MGFSGRSTQDDVTAMSANLACSASLKALFDGLILVVVDIVGIILMIGLRRFFYFFHILGKPPSGET